MPKLKTNAVPTYRLHRQSGQAIVTLNGRDILLGKHNTASSRAEYRRRIAEWIANDRQDVQVVSDLSVTELIVRYKRHAESYYRKPDGTPTSSIHNVRDALKPLRLLYGDTPASEFGPLKLKAVREVMMHPKGSTTGSERVGPVRGWCRSNINKHVGTIKRMFKWAVENEVVPPSVHQGLAAVVGLKAGRCDAVESVPVKPVPEPYIEAVFDHVSPQIKAMIQLQLLTGARSGEICLMRTADIDTSAGIWVYRPQTHKTQHHGYAREIRLGPKAQSILKPFLKTDLQAYIFSPAESEVQRRAACHQARQTALNCGNIPGSNRKKSPKRFPGDRYDVAAYRRAIARACDNVFPPPEPLARRKVRGAKGSRWETVAEWRARLGGKQWSELQTWHREHRWHPHQLRHNAGTRVRREFGIDVARTILGHQHVKATELYAEADIAKANAAMAALG